MTKVRDVSGRRRIGPWGPRRAALLAALALSVAACSPNKDMSGEEWLQNAQQQEAAGDLRGASTSLKNALQKLPNNAEARYRLGLVYINMGDGAAAEKELEQARILGKDPNGLIVPNGRAMMLQGRLNEVLEKVQPPANASSILVSDILTLRGEAFLAQGQSVDAQQNFVLAQEKNPDNVKAMVGMAHMALGQANLPKAKDYAARALKLAPKDGDVQLLQGEIAFSQKDFVTAIAKFQEAIKIAPTQWRYLLYLANAQLNAGKADEAIGSIDRILSIDSRQPQAAYLRALAAYEKKQYAVAKDYSERTLSRDENHLPAMLLAGFSSARNNNLESANAYLVRYLAQVPNDSRARKALGWVQMRMKRPGDALRTLEGAKSEDLDATSLNMMGVAALNNGNMVLARDYLKKALDMSGDQNNPQMMTNLGLATIAAGDTKAGLDQLAAAVAKNTGNANAHATYILKCIQLRQLDRAVTAARAMQAALPKEAAGYMLEGIALAEQNKLPQAEAVAAKAVALAPNDASIAANYAEMLARHDLAAARQALESALKKMPNHPALTMGLAKIMRQQGQAGPASELIKRAYSANPQSSALGIEVARNLIAAGQPAEALKALQTLEASKTRDADLPYLKGLAELALGQREAAINSFLAAVEMRPGVPEPYYQLALAYEIAENFDSMGIYVKKALALRPAEPNYVYANARFLAASGRAGDALSILEPLAKKFPQNLQIQKTLATVLWRAGRPKDATNTLQAVYQAEPNGQNAIQLAGVLIGQNQHDRALAFLHDYLAKKPNDFDVQLFLADGLLRMAKYADAVTEYRKVVAMRPKETGYMNNLANAMAAAGDLKGGKAMIEQAIALSSDDPDLFDTLGLILLKMGQGQQAARNFERAAELDPKVAEFVVHRAMGLMQAGDKAGAKSVLQDLLSSSESFVSRPRAEAMLRELEKQKTP